MSKNFTRRFGRKSKKGGSKLAKQVARNASAIRKIGMPEFKYHRVTVSGLCTTTPGFASLTLIAQGDDEIERIGNSIRLRSMDVSLVLEASTDASSNPQQVARVVIFKDKSPVYQSTLGSSFFTNTDLPEAMIFNKPDRFVVYYDKLVTLSRNLAADTSDGTTRAKYLKKMNINLHNQIQEYESNATTDAIKQNLYIYFIGGQATYGPTIGGYVRLNYSDS